MVVAVQVELPLVLMEVLVVVAVVEIQLLVALVTLHLQARHKATMVVLEVWYLLFTVVAVEVVHLLLALPE